MTNHIQCIRWAWFCSKQNIHFKKCRKKLIWKSNATNKHNSNRKFLIENIEIYYICSCFRHCMTSMTFVKSLRNTHWTHTEYDWSVYWLAFYLICKFHRVWRSIRKMYRNCRVKILASSLKRTVRLFGRKDSNLAEHEENNAFVYTINVGYLVKIAW